MPFNFSSPEYLSHHRTPKNRVSRASPAHMNSSSICLFGAANTLDNGLPFTKQAFTLSIPERRITDFARGFYIPRLCTVI